MEKRLEALIGCEREKIPPEARRNGIAKRRADMEMRLEVLIRCEREWQRAYMKRDETEKWWIERQRN